MSRATINALWKLVFLIALLYVGSSLFAIAKAINTQSEVQLLQLQAALMWQDKAMQL